MHGSQQLQSMWNFRFFYFSLENLDKKQRSWSDPVSESDQNRTSWVKAQHNSPTSIWIYWLKHKYTVDPLTIITDTHINNNQKSCFEQGHTFVFDTARRSEEEDVDGWKFAILERTRRITELWQGQINWFLFHPHSFLYLVETAGLEDEIKAQVQKFLIPPSSGGRRIKRTGIGRESQQSSLPIIPLIPRIMSL